jgi:uncharacterized protein YbaR (Trm112 family)
MEKSFYCPFCHGQLYINERIIFSAKSDGGNYGLILLTPDLGDYRLMKHADFKIESGEHVDFFCPICHSNLMVERENRKFTRVLMLEAGEEFEILFSQIAGEKATYVIGEKSFRAYGRDADENTNFWGAVPNY